MTFDEELTQAFDTLTARLRGEIDREVERRAAEQAAILAERAMDAPVTSPVEATAPSIAADGAFDRLAAGFDAIDAARSLTAVLDALTAFAAAEAPGASLWLIRGGRPHRWRGPQGIDEPEAPAPRLDEGIALAVAGQPVALLSADGERRTSTVALAARYAARALEALTAFTTARALTHKNADSGVRNADSGESTSEEESSARRYARLLVSEIKLYHEPAVIDGRRVRDLATRLGGEIARARVMYEERVPIQVRERHDFFHEELVKTLANGDASLLELRT